MGHRVTRCFILSYRTSICYGITYLDLDLTGDDESYLSRDNGRMRDSTRSNLSLITRACLVRKVLFQVSFNILERGDINYMKIYSYRIILYLPIWRID